MEYLISSKKPNVVWVNEGSIDSEWIVAEYYKPIFLEIINKIKENILNFSKFSEVAKINRVTGFEVEKFLELVDNGIPYLRVSNITECFIDFNNMNYIPEHVHKKFNKSQFKKGDIALTITGRVGTAAIISDNGEYNACQDVVKVTLKNDNIDPYYLTVYLNSKYNYHLLNRFHSGGSRPRTLISNVREVTIPIPSPEIQKYIGDKVRRAEELREEAKRLKEEAELILKEQLLLDKTESLYNNNAGNPSLEFNKYPIKIFVNPSDITTRLDAKSYHPEFYETLNYLQNNNFRTKVLKDMLEDYGTGISSPIYADSGTKILMTKNLKNDTIDLDCKRVDAKIDPKMRVNVEDVLVTTYGGPSIGKVDIFTSNEECVFDYTILKMRFTKDYNPYFMTLLLRSKLIQNQMRNLIKGTTGITFIIPTEILDIQIPIIEKSIQDEIGMLYQHSLKCIEIGKQLIQQAKQDVEDLIEGKFDMSKLNNESSTESRC